MPEIVFSGVSCDEKEKECKVFWLSTIKNKTCEGVAKIPFSNALGAGKINKEIILEDMLKDSKLEINCNIGVDEDLIIGEYKSD